MVAEVTLIAVNFMKMKLKILKMTYLVLTMKIQRLLKVANLMILRMTISPKHGYQFLVLALKLTYQKMLFFMRMINHPQPIPKTNMMLMERMRIGYI